MRSLNRIPVRVQLTVWYVLLLGITLTGITGYLYFRIERKLMIKVDTTLQIAAAQSLSNLDQRDVLAFQATPNQRQMAMRLTEVGLAARLIRPNGTVIDGFGRYDEVPTWIPAISGYKTLNTNGAAWRLISQPIIRQEQTIGWLQVAQSLEPLEGIARELPTELLLNLPIMLALTALGCWLLSNRALRPIRQITQTAQTITSSDLNRRLNYRGANDEVGQLATTFDQMLDRLQAAFDHEQRFTANVAHELRTPLTVMKGQIEVTRSRSRSSAEYDQTLAKLEQEVDRLTRLTNGLLLLAKIDQGQLPIYFEPIDLSNLLAVIVEQIQPLATACQLALINELPAQLWVRGDPDHLTSLFLNLLDNAIKYTPATGTVRLWATLQPTDRMVQIGVSNTGAGIPAQHLPYLFERFYRVESARSSSKGGAGLGLAIAYEIARLHKGTIVVRTQPNEETTFVVSLSIAAAS